ncbi:MAG: hypothetical protein OCD02_02325 [Spirochaetaceae bacterium]
MTIKKELGSCVILNIENNETLGLNTGLTDKSTNGTNFSDIRRDFGYILNGTKLEKFNLPEITEIDGKLVIFSKTLNCGIEPFFTKNNSISEIKELVNFIEILEENSINLKNFARNLFYKTSDGHILMMPLTVIEFLNDRKSLNKKESEVSKYLHPSLSGEQSILYSIGILLFEQLTGIYPIEYNSVEDLRDKMRRKILLKPRWENIKLSDKTCELIENLLNPPEEDSITIKQCSLELAEIKTEGFVREQNDTTEEETVNLKNRTWFLKKESFRAWIIKHRGRIIILGSIIGILGSFFGTIIYGALQPPQTSGFTPEQVVESYFTSFQNLDTELLSDTKKDNVRKSDDNELSTLYVTTKMRTSQGGASPNSPDLGMYTPTEWLEFSDEKKSDVDVYGIYNLKITTINSLEFNVTYEKWFSQADNQDLEHVVMSKYKLVREEIFILEETKYSYQINEIKIISETEEKVW